MRQLTWTLAALACAGAFLGTAHAQAPVNLKMQASWPASLTLYENFTFFTDRVNKMTGGSLFKKVHDSMSAYASLVVPAKRFTHPPYSFLANHYHPEGSAKPAAAKKK